MDSCIEEAKTVEYWEKHIEFWEAQKIRQPENWVIRKANLKIKHCKENIKRIKAGLGIIKKE